MGEPPIYNESMNSSANRLVGSLASEAEGRPAADMRLDVGRPGRQLSLYPGRVGYDLQEELDFLTYRVMEANVFFAPRFLAPAMPRLDDRQIRFAVIRDEDARRSRVRLMMPFSVEKPGFSVGPSILRVWSNPFGPLGTPLVDAEGAAETIDNMLEALARPDAKLPGILVLPDLRLNGRFTQLIKAVAIGRDLPLTVTNTFERPMLESQEDGDTYLKTTISKNHMRDMRRQFRLLGEEGRVSYNVARQPEEIRRRMEEFLALEASGWKGRKRSAMVMDRFRAAFAREAITNLAEVDAVRIHTLDLDGRAIASMVVFIMAGEAYTWKTAYDERYARFSPGKLLLADLTDWHLDDPNIERTDSCAVPDHPIMSRFWKEREEMGTLLIGLRPNADRDMRQAATQLHMYRNTRNLARILRDKILSRRFSD
ncbi:MAG: GNAT family N-acetyltransferase [Alphaproteobacteria bacterium]|nr:GNAT family N-acetyltransferase [Rhizobiaceae bacterium]MBU3960804.1 GNAT family N-acetyltransferase [Alphaproteobacteria bacterium]MBU4052069.1 GNAT family N-acetyltransferase [Alphaproteobacteria bacterium]MBU4089472.1 GNAT family N-acetyltransferase [Alphaproteobacteria bacterium]MBU4158492.1 GNAT family N-acetyltransferase [Alphaproteobacteria bacterium]